MKEKYIDELNRKEELQDQKRYEEIKAYKCHRCEWGSWTGSKYICMFPRCTKETGGLINPPV